MVVASNGRLGVAPSSARYKHDIHDMAGASSRLLKLRPVSFRYNNDPSGAIQYGLVAEEVAKVYPELVVYGPDGKVQTVRYSMLSSMLLNELQKQARQNDLQARQIRRLSAQMAEQQRINATHAAEFSSSQAKQIARLSAQVAELKMMVEQATAKSDGRKLAAVFEK